MTGTRSRSARVRAAPSATFVVAVVAALAAVAGRPAAAQSSVSSQLDTARITVGDRVTLTVTVEHPAGAVARLPDSLSVEPLELLEVRRLEASEPAQGARTAWALTLTAFELGELEVPPIALEVTGPDGTTETVETDGFGVEVVSVGVDESGDIREIRGPLSIPISSWIVLLWVLVPLLVAVLLYLLVRRLGGKGEEVRRPALGPPPRPPYEVALEALAELEASALLERGEVKEYHVALSDILRTYVEERFRVDALEMTTREVLDALASAGADASFRVGLRTVLEACDMVKFAKARPAAATSRETLELARRTIQESVPSPAPESESVGAAAEATA